MLLFDSLPMEILTGLLFGAGAVVLTRQWLALRRYRELFAEAYQLAGLIAMDDDTDDGPDWLTAEERSDAQCQLLDVLADPDGEEACALLLLGGPVSATRAPGEKATPRPPFDTVC